jgi:hypothetical protein
MEPAFNDVMTDLETMDTAKTAAITAIGAVAMNLKTGKLGPTFYVKVNLQSCIDAGLTVDGDTISWWMMQSEAARKEMGSKGIPLRDALLQFADYMHKYERLWGNGASFDNAILANAYKQTKIDMPWDFWNDRCYRTVKNQYPHIEMVRDGTPHHALHDAVNQANHLIAIYKEINNGKVQQAETSVSG